MGWDATFLLYIVMDGSNVNLQIQQDLEPHFEETASQIFLGIDTCTLHKAHMSIKKGVTKLQIDIDQFAVDLHFFSNFLLPVEKIARKCKT